MRCPAVFVWDDIEIKGFLSTKMRWYMTFATLFALPACYPRWRQHFKFRLSHIAPIAVIQTM